jgi:hypothetical protein
MGAMDAKRVEEEWAAALADAGFSSRECILFPSDLPQKSARGAQWCEPGIGMTAAPDDDLLTEELVAELNSPEHLPRHRVVVRRLPRDGPLPVALFSAKLRHELEHARIWTECGPPPQQLSDLADDVLRIKLRGLPNGSIFTNLKPTEQDANAASAMFLRARFPSDVVGEILKHPADAPLARSLTPPGPAKTLVKRMVAFLYLYEDLCTEYGRRFTFGFPSCLDLIGTDVRNLWEMLEAAVIEPYWPPAGPPMERFPQDG